MLELSINEPSKLRTVSHALASEIRINILRLLNHSNMNIIEIAEALDIPVSTAASNIKVLENAGLIITELQAATRGAMKVCSRNFNDIHIILNTIFGEENKNDYYQIEMPVGHYVDCIISAPCGMASSNGFIIREDDPSSFYHPNRVTAQILWFRKGFVEYRFPKGTSYDSEAIKVEFTLELCSEAPNYNNDWPSDITVWVNGIEIGTWTSPGDFGDKRGNLNPSWWTNVMTQYGLLKTWKIDHTGSYIDNMKISTVCISDIQLEKQGFIRFRIGVKESARHVGGINIFGRGFGNYEQDIGMKIQYRKR